MGVWTHNRRTLLPCALTFVQPLPSQREFLFRTAEETGNISQAARQAHVGRGTYYYWRDRYQENGMAGLGQERSRAPKRTRIPPVSEEVRDEVLAYYRERSGERSYRMIAHRLRHREQAEFIACYNDRPHQGAALKGLSPNEYASLLKCSTVRVRHNMSYLFLRE